MHRRLRSFISGIRLCGSVILLAMLNGCVASLPVSPSFSVTTEDPRRDTAFLDAINCTSDPNAIFPIYPYVCLNDELVREDFAAPPSRRAWWVSGPPFFSHHWVWHDPRIRADILRRLREEAPLTSDPPTPLPS